MAKGVGDLSGVMIRPPRKGEAQGVDPAAAMSDPAPSEREEQGPRQEAGQGAEAPPRAPGPPPAQQSSLAVAIAMPALDARSHIARAPSGTMPRKKVQFEVDEVIADWLAYIAHKSRKRQQHVLEPLIVQWVTEVARGMGVHLDGTPISEI